MGKRTLAAEVLGSTPWHEPSRSPPLVPAKSLYFIYLFLAALGLRCCTRAFSSCSERGLLFVAVRRLLIAVVSLVAEHGL